MFHFLSASSPSSGVLPQRRCPGCKSRCPGWALVTRCARARCIFCWLFPINLSRKNGSLARRCERCSQFHMSQWKENLHAMWEIGGWGGWGEMCSVISALGSCDKVTILKVIFWLFCARFTFRSSVFKTIKRRRRKSNQRLFSYYVILSQLNLFISALIYEFCDTELD